MLLLSIPSPHTGVVHVGPLQLHMYGLTLLVAILACIWLTGRRWQRIGGDWDLVTRVAVWGVGFGVLGARLYHDVTSWSEVPTPKWQGMWEVWKGGLGIWGGIALGTAVGIWRLRRARVDVASFLDCAAPGLLVAQAIGRIGNYFNQELFGGPTTLPWALQIDPAHRPAGYASFATFHPTFLYELIFDLVLAVALAWLVRRDTLRSPGVFALYVAGYSGFRIFEELLRVDPARHILGLRINFFVAAVLCIAGLAWFVVIQRPRTRVRSRAVPGP